jgi:hypothetical protein
MLSGVGVGASVMGSLAVTRAYRSVAQCGLMLGRSPRCSSLVTRRRALADHWNCKTIMLSCESIQVIVS